MSQHDANVDQPPLQCDQKQADQDVPASRHQESSVFSKFETSQQIQSAASYHCRALLQQAPTEHLRGLLENLHLEVLQILSSVGDTHAHRSAQEWAAAVMLGPNWKQFSTHVLEDDSSKPRRITLTEIAPTTSVDFYGFCGPTDRSAKNFQQVKQLQAHRIKWQQWLSGCNIKQVPCSYLSPTCQVELKPAPVMSSEMRDLVRKGVPVDLRGYIWFQVSGAYVKCSKAAALRKEGELSYYQHKLQDLSAGLEQTQSQRDILKDIGRTWTSNVVHMDDAFRSRLQNVLMCYSIRNPQIGYCQSMNFIAGLFLLFLDEESAFWLLATLVEELMPQFFGRSLFALVRDQEILSQYVKEKLPKLHAHFKSLDCDGSVVKLMTTEWFLCIYCKSLPIETAFRIWDMFFYDGPKVIFRCALAVLKLSEDDLMKEHSELEIVSKLAELTNDMFDSDKIIETCFVEFRSISRADLSHRRKVMHLKMAKTANTEASHSAFARIHDYTGISEKAAKALLADFEGNHQSAPCLHDNEGQIFATVVDYVSFSTLCRSMFKWAADCFTLQNNAGASARTAMLLLFQALGGDTLRMNIPFSDMVIGFWQLIFGTSEERLKIAFNFFDTDRNGRLKRTNVLSVLPVIPVLFQHTRTLENPASVPDEVSAASLQPEEELQLGNIEFCQRYCAMLFGEATMLENVDQCQEIDEAAFGRNAKSVAIIVEFFYINRSVSRTLRSFLWVKGFEDELSFSHLRKFTPNFDRDCKMLLAMIRAEQWPKEEGKKGGVSFFSAKKLEHVTDDLQFQGKALVDYVLKIQWQHCRSRRKALELCQQLVDFYFIYSAQEPNNLHFDDSIKTTYVVYGEDIGESIMGSIRGSVQGKGE